MGCRKKKVIDSDVRTPRRPATIFFLDIIFMTNPLLPFYSSISGLFSPKSHHVYMPIGLNASRTGSILPKPEITDRLNDNHADMQHE